MTAALNLSKTVGKKGACDALSLPRASYYRYMQAKKHPQKEIEARPSPPLALSDQERQDVLDILHSERFQDKAPYQVLRSSPSDAVGCIFLGKKWTFWKDCSVPTVPL